MQRDDPSSEAKPNVGASKQPLVARNACTTTGARSVQHLLGLHSFKVGRRRCRRCFHAVSPSVSRSLRMWISSVEQPERRSWNEAHFWLFGDETMFAQGSLVGVLEHFLICEKKGGTERWDERVVAVLSGALTSKLGPEHRQM
jgi:hypothetical protein